MLDLDKFVEATKVHEIVWKGKKYAARPLSLGQFAKIQAVYNSEDADLEGGTKAIRSLLVAVGYPADELIEELPLNALMELQTQLFTGLSGGEGGS